MIFRALLLAILMVLPATDSMAQNARDGVERCFYIYRDAAKTASLAEQKLYLSHMQLLGRVLEARDTLYTLEIPPFLSSVGPMSLKDCNEWITETPPKVTRRPGTEKPYLSGSGCIAFGEFRAGLHGSGAPDVLAMRKAFREKDPIYVYYSKRLSPEQLTELDQAIDKSGAGFEAEYLSLKAKNTNWTGRADFAVSDLCMGILY